MRPPAPTRLADARGDTLQWSFRRNCSITPSQLAATYAALCVVSLTVAGFFWFMGARLIMPFAVLELLAVGTAFVLYARHATNRERIELSPARLVVEQEQAGRVTRVVFNREQVQVECRNPPTGLIEVSDEQQRVRWGRHVRQELREQVAQDIRLALKGF